MSDDEIQKAMVEAEATLPPAVRKQRAMDRVQKALEAEEDQAGGYKTVEDVSPLSIEAALNAYWRRGWKLVTTMRGHGGETLILFKEPK